MSVKSASEVKKTSLDSFPKQNYECKLRLFHILVNSRCTDRENDWGREQDLRQDSFTSGTPSVAFGMAGSRLSSCFSLRFCGEHHVIFSKVGLYVPCFPTLNEP